jgi:hypothetical protein
VMYQQFTLEFLSMWSTFKEPQKTSGNISFTYFSHLNKN